MKTLIKSHPVWAYAILACGMSWLIQLPGLIALKGDFHFTENYILLLNVASYAPSLAALILTAMMEGWIGVKALLQRLFRWRVSGLVYLATFFVFPLIFFFGFELLGIRAADGVDLLVFLTLVVAAPINSILVAVFAGIGPLGEELGWRGFMLPHLLKRYGDFQSSVILGLVWAFWHLPVFLFPEWRGDVPMLPSIVLYSLGTIAIAYCMTKLHHWSGGSVLIAILFHGVINFVADSQEYWRTESFSPVGIRIIITSLFVVTAIVFWSFSKIPAKQVDSQRLPIME
ncbi:MAG: CPBP family intramembrane metalloprotease [Anaerolineales bacterium]|nr:CPBP family intramembrane metalloprotease [Anaerolineales bacterium]